MTSLGTLLFGGTRGQILALLFLQPEQSFYLREISRITGISPGTLHRELGALEEVGLVSKASVGNQVRFQAERRSPVFPELATLLKKTFGLVDVLREALEAFASSIEVAAVFGSVARGEERRDSDVDLLVIGDIDFTKLVLTLQAPQQRLGREINPVVHSRAGFDKLVDSKDRFVHRILKEPLLFVMGNADDLGQPAQD
jgi:predicted nucleotidyltransferase